MRWTGLALFVLIAGCHHGGANVVGTVHGGDTDFVVTWSGRNAEMFLRSDAGTSLSLSLLGKADVDQAIAMIETGLHATPAAAGPVVLARMNTGRPEARVVANGAQLALEIGNRADAAPAPTFSIALTPVVAGEIEDVLRQSRERLP